MGFKNLFNHKNIHGEVKVISHVLQYLYLLGEKLVGKNVDFSYFEYGICKKFFQKNLRIPLSSIYLHVLEFTSPNITSLPPHFYFLSF